jgi:hypothetical protein
MNFNCTSETIILTRYPFQTKTSPHTIPLLNISISAGILLRDNGGSTPWPSLAPHTCIFTSSLAHVTSRLRLPSLILSSTTLIHTMYICLCPSLTVKQFFSRRENALHSAVELLRSVVALDQPAAASDATACRVSPQCLPSTRIIGIIKTFRTIAHFAFTPG